MLDSNIIGLLIFGIMLMIFSNMMLLAPAIPVSTMKFGQGQLLSAWSVPAGRTQTLNIVSQGGKMISQLFWVASQPLGLLYSMN